MGQLKFKCGVAICLLLFSIVVHALPGQPNLERKDEASPNDSDWLVDLIEDLLGLTVSELLKIIHTALVSFKGLIELAESELEGILSQLTPSARDVVQNVISVTIKDVLDKIQPILDQLDEIMPIISSHQNAPKDLITDLIEHVLGITLYELLTSVTQVMYDVYDLILTAILDLTGLSGQVSGGPAETIENVVENMFVEGLESVLNPVLYMLAQLFPESPFPHNKV